jgi:hydrogenase expression/formation protein HypE
MKVKFPTIGKISPEFFDNYIFPRLGAKREEVIVPPQHGVDTGVVRIGDGKVMILTTDPVYILPAYGWEKAAWFAWHILASDVTTSGFPPAYISVDFNLPMSITEEEFEIIWRVWDEESKKYGAMVVAGHTARYPGTDYPMVGGATFISIGDEDKFLTPKMAQPGDALIITKGPAVETVGIFANLFPNYIAENLGSEIAEKGRELFYKMSTVDDALTAVSVGYREEGVRAMHDATECGILGGVYEMAQASNVGVILYKDKIPVYEGVLEICKLFNIEPYSAISEGTLIISAVGDKADEVVRRLREKGIPAEIVGEFLPREKGMWLVDKDGQRPLEHPRVDPFWSAIDEAIRRGLS